jgi:deazaflavin-dependent oxidoreductase (nitroreductase family)
VFLRTFPYFSPLKRVIPAVHLAVFRATNGRFGSKLKGQHMLLLITKGRRSGKRWTVPLLYVPDADRYVVIGSNWGGDRDPLWVRNVAASPEARVQVGPKKLRVTAHIATPDERPRLWSLVTAAYPGYDTYAHRLASVREIPLVVLTPPPQRLFAVVASA